MSQPILNVGTEDTKLNLVPAQNNVLGDIHLHANSLLNGFGKGKVQIINSYQPQSGIGSQVENAQFDILIPYTTDASGINIIDELYLELDIKCSSAASTEVIYKPIQQWFNRCDISQDGGNIIQTIYFDEQYASLVTNSYLSNLDDVKEQLNLDPRNYLSWYADKAAGNTLTIDAGGNITNNAGNVGKNTYLSQPYAFSSGTVSGAAAAGQLAAYNIFSKGDPIASTSNKSFILPIFDTFLQTGKILMNKMRSNIRFRFYMNNEVKLFDSGVGPNISTTTFNNANLWVVGQSLSQETINRLDVVYLTPVVSNFTYYLEYTQDFVANGPPKSFYESVLSPITGYVSSLCFWLEDIRDDIVYPGNLPLPAPQFGVYKQNNMMTLPINSYVFVQQNGTIFGSGNYQSSDLVKMQNVFRKTPKSVSNDNNLYNKTFYYLNFCQDPITVVSEAIYQGSYSFSGRERLRFTLPDALNFPAGVFPNAELDVYGNNLGPIAANPPYTSFRLHVVAKLYAEIIQNNGNLIANIPRDMN